MHGSNLIDVFEVADLALEALDTLSGGPADSDAMPAVRIPGREDCYFAESACGDFYLLISGGSDVAPTQTQLEALRVSSGSNFRLDHADGTSTESRFVYACLAHGSAHLISTFGMMCGILLHSLPPNPVAGDLQQLLNDFLELFAQQRTVERKTVVGLWGEMWILESFASEELAASWHSDVGDRFDFALDAAFIEVKTTEGPERRHSFSLPQLLPQSKRTFVASLSITPDSSGQSISDLLVSLLTKLAPESGARISRICLSTLAGDLEASSDFRFSPTGSEPLKFFDGEEIPRVVVPEGAPISHVRFTVDLSTVKVLDGDFLSLAGGTSDLV